MIRLADGRSAYGYWREPVTNQEIINFFAKIDLPKYVMLMGLMKPVRVSVSSRS